MSVESPEELVKNNLRVQKNLQRGVFFLCIAVSLLAILGYETYLPHTSFAGTKTVKIPQGLGSRKIGALLKNEGVVNSKWIFVLYVTLKGESSSLKPGSYAIENLSVSDIAEKLVSGGNNEITIVIPEGWNVYDIGQYLEEKKLFSKERFFQATKTLQSTYKKTVNNETPQNQEIIPSALLDKSAQVGFEGYLFPDTYRVFDDSTPDKMVLKMLQNFDAKLTMELRGEISRQKKTIFQIVTMASLIEKEVTSDNDRALVSGILWKRIAEEMLLQVDASVAYIKKAYQRNTAKQRVVSIQDTKIESPYNTYIYKGLPIGPISNPGLSAIKAAIFPQASPYVYYLSTPDGKTIYSRTLEEHNKAKAKYLK